MASTRIASSPCSPSMGTWKRTYLSPSRSKTSVCTLGSEQVVAPVSSRAASRSATGCRVIDAAWPSSVRCGGSGLSLATALPMASSAASAISALVIDETSKPAVILAACSELDRRRPAVQQAARGALHARLLCHLHAPTKPQEAQLSPFNDRFFHAFF